MYMALALLGAYTASDKRPAPENGLSIYIRQYRFFMHIYCRGSRALKHSCTYTCACGDHTRKNTEFQ